MNSAPAILLFVWGVVLAGIPYSPVDAYTANHDEHTVYRVTPTTQEHLNVLRSMKKEFKTAVSFPRSTRSIDQPVDIKVSRQKRAEIVSIFEKSELSHHVVPRGVGGSYGNEHSDDEEYNMDWTDYQRLEVIFDWLDNLEDGYPNEAEVLTLGKSYENRLIQAIQIIFDPDNPGILLDATLHGREWISAAVITYFTNEVLTSTDPQFSAFAKSYNWFVIPVANPDGYEYTHTTDRGWRKNRRPHENGCVGTDMNRNFGLGWKVDAEAGNDPCKPTYAGPTAFSEVETRILADYITSVKNRFYIYISLHSYAQVIMFPWGYTTQHIPKYNEVKQVAQAAATALARRYGTQFTVGSISESLYIATGTSADYVTGSHNIPFSFVYELRDEGTAGFLLPSNEIIPSSLEFMDSVKALAEETRKLNYP